MTEDERIEMLYGKTDKPMTNADRIRAMTDDEMASILTDDFCELLCSAPVVCNGDCEAKMLEWLRQEAET